MTYLAVLRLYKTDLSLSFVHAADTKQLLCVSYPSGHLPTALCNSGDGMHLPHPCLREMLSALEPRLTRLRPHALLSASSLSQFCTISHENGASPACALQEGCFLFLQEATQVAHRLSLWSDPSLPKASAWFWLPLYSLFPLKRGLECETLM